MSPNAGDPRPEYPTGAGLAATHWSAVMLAGQSSSPEAQHALETLCRSYWYPLYAYVRRQGHTPHDAQDLTQDFFATFLAKDYVSAGDASGFSSLRSIIFRPINGTAPALRNAAVARPICRWTNLRRKIVTGWK